MGMLQMKQYNTFWELSSFVMNPLFQGQGHGRRMLKGILEKVDSPVCLRVKQGNTAYKLYESVGFEEESLGDGRYYMKYLK
jgi:ribosomal protein S18 acetylase RimI-like enzyme